jgi:hypothetical protein
MGPMLEDKNQMRLSVHESSEWSTIDLGDVVDATHNLCFTDTYSGSSGDRKNKTLFTLAADNTVTAKDVVRSANEALNKDMTYDRVNPKDLVTYLQKIRKDNRFKRQPFEQLELLKKDHPYTFPLGKYLTDTNIETLVEWWRLADDGKTNVTSDDLRRTLGCPPQNIDLFFKQNSDQFRLLR